MLKVEKVIVTQEQIDNFKTITAPRRIYKYEDIPPYFKNKIEEELPKIIKETNPEEIWLVGSITKGYWYDGTDKEIEKLRKDFLKKNHISDIDIVILPTGKYTENTFCSRNYLQGDDNPILLWQNS